MPSKGTIPPVRRPLIDRLWSHTDRSGDHWLWQGAIKGGGYGSIGLGGKGAPNSLVHRVAWELADGKPIEPGYVVAHVCDIRNCIRNDERGTYDVLGESYPRWGHLFLCPSIINEADKFQKGRQARGETNGRVLHPEAYPVGSALPQAKLTEQDVQEIRRLYQVKEKTQVQLAALYGVRQSSIWAILRRHTWKHVP